MRIPSPTAALLAVLVAAPAPGAEDFHLPADPRYTIVDSVIDSLRFTVEKTLAKCPQGHLASISTFVDPEGKPQGWHDFGNLEGPGWAANAAGGAHELHALGSFLRRPEWQEKALAVLDHVLDHGFIDESTGFIKGYRDTAKDTLCLNYKHNSDWFCPGSMAKVAYQLLVFADDLGADRRAGRMRAVAVNTARWLHTNVPEVKGGWFPRRITPAGEIYPKSPDGGNDAFLNGSADGLFILQLWAGLTRRGLANYAAPLARRTAVFLQQNGIFGSINHDTYDAHESVAYAVAFRVLLEVSRVLKNESVRAFAYSDCLKGLDTFKMADDRNGVATRGLLYMEKTWPTAYLWENAEAALAYFEAAKDLRQSMEEASRKHERDGLTILRAIARHHHGPHGFLTEGVDWSNHVGKQHHIDDKEFAAIRYTEPFLNNQHIAEPTLFYLKHLARVATAGGETSWSDSEGNVILKLPAPGSTQDGPAREKPATKEPAKP
jgi:hypothetical protein